MQDSRFTCAQVSDIYIAKPGEQPVKLTGATGILTEANPISNGQPVTITNPTEVTFTMNAAIGLRGIMQITYPDFTDNLAWFRKYADNLFSAIADYLRYRLAQRHYDRKEACCHDPLRKNVRMH